MLEVRRQECQPDLFAEDEGAERLTKEQRRNQIRRYNRLREKRREIIGQSFRVSGGPGVRSIATEIAEMTGRKSRTARRA